MTLYYSTYNPKHIRDVYNALEDGIFRDATFGRDVTVTRNLTVLGNITFGDASFDNFIIKGRLSTMTAAGAAVEIDATTYQYEQGCEIRYKVTDWSDTYTLGNFQAMYLRAESAEANTTANLSGLQVYSVAIDVNQGYIQGVEGYGYMKGSSAATTKRAYGVHGEFTTDASATKTISEEAAGLLGKIILGSSNFTGLTKVHGAILRFGCMDGLDPAFGSGLLIEDDGDTSGTCTLTTGINVDIDCTTGISLSSNCTAATGIDIAGACAIAIDVGGVATTMAFRAISQTKPVLQGVSTITLAADTNVLEINAISSSNPGSNYELRGIYSYAYPSTIDQANSGFVAGFFEVAGAFGTDYLRGVYSYLNFSAAETHALGCACVHADINVANAVTISAGPVTGVWAQYRGAAAVTTADTSCFFADIDEDIDVAFDTNVADGKTCTTGLHLGLTGTGTYTTGISIGAAGTGIAIGACTTAAINISGDQAIGILYDVDAAATDGLKLLVDDGVTVTTGINLARTGTTGICTTGISIDTDGTTAISIGAGFTGTTGIAIVGTATDGINISGICGDGIEISAAATTTGLNISADCVTGITIGAQTTAGITIGATATGISIGTATTGMVITGTVTNGIDLTGATLTQAIDNALISVGSYSNAQAVTMTEHYIPLQIVLTNDADVGKTLSAAYFKVGTAGSTVSTQYVTHMIRMNIDNPTESCYGIQSHLTFGASGTIATEVIGVSAQVDNASATPGALVWGIKAEVKGTTAGTTQAAIFSVTGAGASTQNIRCENLSGSTITSLLYLQNAGTCGDVMLIHGTYSHFANFDDAATCVATITGAATTVANQILVKMLNGSTGYINVYSSTGS